MFKLSYSISPKVTGLTLSLAMLATQGFSQTRSFQGRLVDSLSQGAIHGATIRNSHLAKLVSSDHSGKFVIDAHIGDTLRIGYMGYLPKVFIVGNQPSSVISLIPNQQSLNEVVVTALGIKKEKQAIGYSVQEIKGKDMVKAREPNAISGLAGRVSGLTITPSTNLFGDPGITLRGRSNILIVVDGMPINTDSWNLSPDDIESYSVLKGANAAALYGNRGQNGAIVITTKRAKSQDKGFQVEFNSSTQLQTGYNAIPKIQTEYGPGSNYQYAFKDGRGGGINDNDYNIWGPRFEGQLIPQYNSPIDPKTGQLIPLPWEARGKDNLKKFLQNGLLSTNNIAISTKNDHGDLRLSASQMFQRGTTPNTKLGSTNINLTGGINAGSKLRFDASINYNKQYSPNYPNIAYGPNSPIYILTLWGAADYDIDDLRNYWQPGKENVQQYNREYTIYDNPWMTAYENLRTYDKDDIYGYVSANYKLNDQLSLNARTSASTWNRNRTIKIPISANLYNYNIGGSRVGGYQETYDTFWENNTEVSLKYQNRIAEDIGFSGSVFGNLRTVSVKSLFARTDRGLTVPGVYDLSNSIMPTVSTNDRALRQVGSVYGFMDVNYKSMLFLNLTGRFDKSSTMPVKNNTYFYPSASLSAVISQMVTLPKVISALKIRGAYANVASDFVNESAQYDIYKLLPAYSNYGRWANSMTGVTYTDVLPNPDLVAERVKTAEIGLETRLFNNRLGFDFAFFRNLEGPRIIELATSVTSGVRARQTNGLTLLRKGIELSIDGTLIQQKDFSWNVMVNASTNHAWLHDIDGHQTRSGNVRVGERWDGYYVNDFQRDEKGMPIVGTNGLPAYNPYVSRIGYSDNKFTASISNSFRYRDFSFSFLVDGRFGGLIKNVQDAKQWGSGTHPESANEYRLKDWENRDVKDYKGTVMTNGLKIVKGQLNTDQDGKIISDTREFAPNDISVLWQNWATNYYQSGPITAKSRTFVKLREIVFSYNVPANLLKNSRFFRSASVSVVGRNLLYFTGKGTQNMDLDQFTSASSDYQTPSVKSFGLNLNATF
ncbi:SusC/RagA family TonB-linked outer membrane protein [Sphingobacterium paramultivorum]|uniref:SusC/RagA family TonB-linked outer membrane protein n=1 Tax=Sphingobacterium paramultivorum TaxID=2886510 RepID=A0A7G5DWL8_9SPHI|nr:SusC/RagA family TonB-linked outer membrane protein [Sphingobacterium paramultivorum]QMV66143.1 SusC/RagA family TonB-linked outer membrane protein [Sphingobacterium paramultivorum]WSO14912.1 SusC/RagA family TonB-linked outer membrane protein [Sphingobacterium paramultivorum]